MDDFKDILSNIRSIGYFLANKKDFDEKKRLEADAKAKNKNIVSNITDMKLADLQFNLDKLNNYFSKREKQTILRIKICIASSAKLKKERNEIESYLYWKNDKLIDQGVYLHYNVWEKQSPRFNDSRKQEDYNEALVFDSEIFICLISDDVGGFTKEEFDKAKERFDKGEKPFVFVVYFEDENKKYNFRSDGWSRRVALEEFIKKEFKQFYGTFDNKDKLIRNINNFIDEDIEIVKKRFS